MKTQEAINFFGGRKQLAVALGITRTASYEWGEEVPELRQFQIEVITRGALLSDYSKARFMALFTSPPPASSPAGLSSASL